MKMKVVAWEGVRAVRVQERPYPVIKPDEAVVKVKYCGICGSDLHSYQKGRKEAIGLVPGHEVVGTVVEVGKNFKNAKIGDRVVVGPPGNCGECYYCLHGQEHLCLHAYERTVGLSPGVDGGMAEYVRVPLPKNMLVKIPDAVSFEDAVLIDTIAVSYHGVRISDFRMGDNVVVAGAGPIGLAAIQFIRNGGAGHITVLQPSPAKRELAMKCGANLGLNPREEGEGLQKKIMDLYGGVGADLVFECAGTPESFQTLLPLLRRGGQLLMLGTILEPISFFGGSISISETDIKGSFVYQADEIRQCLDFIAQGKFKTDGLVTSIIKLDDIVEKGFERLEQDKSMVKIVVAP
jgi:2-desacetyl-2-hydroxyethyl bacteriochlorophyllide A dehydrogenase